MVHKAWTETETHTEISVSDSYPTLIYKWNGLLYTVKALLTNLN